MTESDPRFERLVVALEPWTGSAPRPRGRAGAAAELAAALGEEAKLRSVWLTLAVLRQALPTEHAVRSAHRILVDRGPVDFLAPLIRQAAKSIRMGRTVELLRERVVVDVRHTAETDLATGIQRVARETVKRWESKDGVVLVTWTRDGRSMRRLTPDERATALFAERPMNRSTRVADRTMVVPVDGYYILPELAAETWRTERVASLAQFSGIATSVIGFDCVPLTTAETVGDGMPNAFALNLSAVAKMTRVGAISDAAATEYAGWRRMLSASGFPGPDIRSVILAAEPGYAGEADRQELATTIGLGTSPLVLVVGSHEPRKNHMAVLQAAELAWREGLDFQLLFVGGNSWNSLDFSDALERLEIVGRPVQALTMMSDRLLWAAYQLSRFTIFASINEGFGLPVAESLVSGTPVITSAYGSMEQIASHGGALTVDPRSDESILSGIRAMLDPAGQYEVLRAQAANYEVRTWDQYAADLWNYFVPLAN